MKVSIRNLVIGLVIIIVLAFIVFRGDQLDELFSIMKQGLAVPLLLAMASQLGKYVAQSFAYRFSFKAVGEEIALKATLPLVFGTFFVNTIAPSLNLAGTSLVVDDARRRGINPGHAGSAAVLMQITVDGAFMTLMALGFFMLTITVGLDPIWLALGSIVVVLVGAMVGILVLAHFRPGAVRKVFLFAERLVNRVRARFKKTPTNPWAERVAESFSEASGLIVQNPRRALAAYGCSLIASVCELTCFSLVAYAFAITGVKAWLCGYVVATLFAMVSFTPQGVGFVEAFITGAFALFGYSGAEGMAVAVVYRGLVFWMPFLIGAVMINLTKTFKGEKPAQ